jgi:hypothetical protein
VGTAAVAVSLAQSPADIWWTGYGNGSDNSRYFASRQVAKSNVNQLQIAWTYPHGDTGSSPIVVRGVVYGRDRNGSLVAVDAKTGRELWIRELLAADNKGIFTPISLKDTVHVPASNGGTLFGGIASEPRTGAVYVVAHDNPGIVRLLRPGEGRGGGGALPVPPGQPSNGASALATIPRLLRAASPVPVHRPSTTASSSPNPASCLAPGSTITSARGTATRGSRSGRHGSAATSPDRR